MAPSVNHFARLGISIGAGEDEIKKAYRTLAKKWHPDKNKEQGAKEKFQEIAASYEYLSSKDRREMHERELRKPAEPPKPPPQPAYTKPTTTTTTTFSSKPATSGTAKPSSSGTKQKKKQNEASWSESFTKKYRSQQAKQGQTGPQTNFFTTTDSSGLGRSGFTYDDTTHTTPPSETDDIFEELFGDFFNAMGFGVEPGGLAGGTAQKKKPRPRNVAPENGVGADLDDEYLFNPHSRSDGDKYTEKLPCPWCGQLFTRGKLAQHEEKCGKFGLSADEDEEVEFDSEEDDVYSYYSSLSTPGFAHRPTWQQQQEELRNQIRRDKLRHRDRMASQGSRNQAEKTRYSQSDEVRCGYIKCPYCERSFNQNAAGRHIPWCHEHLRNYGQPMSPRSNLGRNREDSRTGTQTSPDAGLARERAREYSKNIPKPGARKGVFDSYDADIDADDYDSDDTSAKDGNNRKFPYHRGPVDPDFGVSGRKVGTEGQRSTSATRSRPQAEFTTGLGMKTGSGFTTFTAKASFQPRGKVNVKVGAKFSKPGAYSSSFKTRKF